MRPHIVLISLDTTRADFLGLYGHPWSQTPTLDALARDSIVFDACQTPAPSTLASHTSLFTGAYPHSHGVARNRFRVHDDNVMLPEWLREHGYATAGFIGAFPLHSRFNFAQGFDHYDDSLKDGRLKEGGNVRSAEAVVDAFLAFLERADMTRPHFLFLHFYDPHDPYDPPEKFLDLYTGSSRPPSDRGGAGPDGEEAEKLVRYAAEITSVDHELGRAFDALRQRELLESSIVLVTNDHGETMRERRPFFTHGPDVYEATTRCIGILRLPGAARGGSRVSEVVSTIDFMPTLLDQIGLAAPANVEGLSIDLERAIRGELSGRTAYSEATMPRDLELEARAPWANRHKSKSIRRGAYKLLWNPLTGREELYDVVADPNERLDLLPGAGEALLKTVESLRGDLRQWADRRGEIPSEEFGDAVDDVQERLKALGYLE